MTAALSNVACVAVGLALAGCIVAPCPKGMNCSGPTAAPAAGGASSAGGRSAGVGGNSGRVDDASVGHGGASGGNGANTDGPPPIGAWVDATSNLAPVVAQPTDACGNLVFVSLRGSDGALVAGVRGAGMWLNTDGLSWGVLGNSAIVSGRPSSVLFDPGDPNVVWAASNYDQTTAAYKATDGNTFAPLGDVHHIESLSIDFGDPARKTIVAGAHQRTRSVFRWNETGASWDSIGTTLPAEANNSSYPLVIDSQTYLVGCSGGGGTVSGIYRTTDGGTTWSAASAMGGHGSPLVATNGDIYWASDDEAGIAKSADQGATWQNVVTQKDPVASITPVELPDGRLVSLSTRTASDQYVVASSDGGATWQRITANVPFHPLGLLYNTPRMAFYIWYTTCGLNGQSYAVAKYDFDYKKQ